MSTRKIGRHAGTGRFMSVADAQEYAWAATVETIDVPDRKQPRRHRRAVRHLSKEKQNRAGRER